MHYHFTVVVKSTPVEASITNAFLYVKRNPTVVRCMQTLQYGRCAIWPLRASTDVKNKIYYMMSRAIAGAYYVVANQKRDAH